MESVSTPERPAHVGAAPVAPASGLKRAFNRIFTRHLMNIAVLVTLPVIFTASLNLQREVLRDPDIWFHLADARQLMSTHHFIWTEAHSFTVAGQPWVNPEWLSELPYWFSYQAFHLRGIYLAEFLIIGANIVFVYWRAYLRSGHAGAAWWAAALAFLLITVNAGPRTIALGYLAMSSELVILEAYERGNQKMLWLLPPLFCVWVNLHGSWLIGLGLLGLYILCGAFDFKMGAIEQRGFSPAQRKRLIAVLGLCIAVLFVNPYGWHLVWNPIDMVMNQKLNIASVMEWKPLNLSTIAGMAAFAAMCLMVVTNAFKGRAWRVFELAIVFFAWYAALDHMRFLFMAAVLTTPMLALDIRRGFELESGEKTIPVANAFMVAVAAVVVFSIFPSEKNLREKLGNFFPMQSLADIQPSWRTFNSDLVGGMMNFQSKPDFIDSRLDIFEHHGVLGDYLSAMLLGAPLEVLDKYRIDHVLVQENLPITYLLKHTPGWIILKREKTGDDTYVTFARVAGVSGGAVPAPLTAVQPVNK